MQGMAQRNGTSPLPQRDILFVIAIYFRAKEIEIAAVDQTYQLHAVHR